MLTCTEGDGRTRRELPWVAYASEDSLEHAARQVIREAVGVAPSWLAQGGAFDARKRHPSDAGVSVAFIGLVAGARAFSREEPYEWCRLQSTGGLPSRQRAMLDESLALLRERIDFDPLAFRLLPDAFTLSDLQLVYEEILGQSLHKASFRRALQASGLVEPLDEYRSEGRGRPAQLFRYAPRARTPAARSARFDLLARD